MDNQADFVEDASRDNSRIANSRGPLISTDMHTPPAVANERPSDVQASSIIRMPPYSHAVPVLKDTETTQHFSPNVQPISSPAATRHNPTPRAVTAGHSTTPNVPIGRQDHLVNAHTPAKSSQAEYARSSEPQRSSPLSTSTPPQASHNGKRPCATSVAFAVTPSERTHARSGKNVLKRSIDHKNDDHSSHKRSRGPRNGSSNQPIAVQADEREWWDDARFDPPKDRYEMQALQEALAPTIRTFATISGRPSPEVSPCTPYGYQYRFLQRAMLEHWKADRRLGSAPMLAGLCAWPGGIMGWGKARVHTSEEDLVAYKHPSLLVPQIRPGSLLWYQDFAREWFQGDEEDRRRQDAIQTELMQGDLERRQATGARTRVEAVSAQVRSGAPARRRAAPVNPRRGAINAQARPNTEVPGQPVTEARTQGKEDASHPRAETSAPRQASTITLHKTSIRAHAPGISQVSGEDATGARLEEGIRPSEEGTIHAIIKHQEIVPKEEAAGREEIEKVEEETAAQPTSHADTQRQALGKAFRASTGEVGFLVKTTSDSIIAQHPKEFAKFLLECGFRYYMSDAHACTSWEAWCTGLAPRLFERATTHCHATVSQNSSAPSASAVARNGSSPSVGVFRCTITLEQARMHYNQRPAVNTEGEARQPHRL